VALQRLDANQNLTRTQYNLLLDEVEAVPPLAVLRASAAQSVVTATFTALTFDTEDADTEGGHSTSSDTSRYNVPRTGWWDCTGTIVWGASVTGLRIVQWYVNGVPKNQGTTQVPTVTTGGSGTTITAAARLYLVAGDYIELYGYQTSGGNLNATGYAQYMWASA
jgi:hypothetical protein